MIQTNAHSIAKVVVETPYGDYETEALVSDAVGPGFDMILGAKSQDKLGITPILPTMPLVNTITRSQSKAIMESKQVTIKPDMEISMPKDKPLESENEEETEPQFTPLAPSDVSILTPSSKSFMDLLKITKDEFEKRQKEDDSLSRCWEVAKFKDSDKDPGNFFFLKNCRLYRRPPGFREEYDKSQLVLPTQCRKCVLDTAHTNAWSGHLGQKKTKDRILQLFYWPRVFADVEDFVNSCLTCQKTGKTGEKFRAPMALVPLESEPFERLVMDLVGPVRPKTKAGFLYILTLLCPATKFPEAIPLKDTSSQSVVDALLVVFSRIGFPGQLQSDLGSQFVSNLTSHFLERCGIKVVHSSVAHPQSNSVERFHRSLKQVLRAVCDEHPHDWERCLPGAMFALRTVPSETTGFSPAEMVYGKNLRSPLSLLKEQWTDDSIHPTVVEHVLDLLGRFQYSREIALENAVDAQNKNKTYYDRKATERKFKEGELVMTLRPSRTNKLEVYWEGPNKILKRISDTNYLVEKNTGRKKPTVYHINMLKPFIKRTCYVNHIWAPTEEVDVSVIPEWTGEPGAGSLTSKEALSMVKSLGKISNDQREQLTEAIDKVPGVFSTLPGRTHLVVHDLELNDDTPVMAPLHRNSLEEKTLMITEVNRMIGLGLIQPSDSPYGSPMMVVCKEGVKPRPVTDYRTLNAKTKPQQHPIPNIDECVETASKWKFISTFDLNRGFWQVGLTDRARKYAAIMTPIGKYEPLIMNMGMRNAPFCFQQLMEKVCKGLESFVTPFQDDTAVGSSSWEEHLENLVLFLSAVKKAGLTINASKCQLAQDHVLFLGHEIGQGYRSPSEVKVLAVKSFCRPRSKRDVRSFLGLIGYYQRYISGYSQLSSALTDSLRKQEPDPITWDEKKEWAFETLKSKLIEKPVLRSPDFNEVFIVQTDCSERGMGVILSQDINGEEHPCLFLSRKLNPREQAFGTTEKECACLVWAVAKLKPYLFGKHFKIQSDHNPLHWLSQMANKNARLLRWSLSLQELDYEVIYRRGRDHVNADVMSRYFAEPE